MSLEQQSRPAGAFVGRRKREVLARGAVDLAEESFHLVWRAPVRLLAAYAVGTVPFMLGLLFFWADASCSSVAGQTLAPAALILTVLFVWMKAWQTVYAAGLHDLLVNRGEPAGWSLRRIAGMVCLQAAVQPWGLILIPAALLLMFPFNVIHGLFQNLTVFGSGTGGVGIRAHVGRAWAQATAWPGQGHVLLWLLSPWVLGGGLFAAYGSVWLLSELFPNMSELQGVWGFMVSTFLFFSLVFPVAPLGCVVAANMAMLLAIAPQLWQALSGQANLFTVSGGYGLMNTTFLMAVFVLTYLVLDPFLKAACVLRCYYGEARRTGLDLRASLLPGVAFLVLCAGAGDAMAGGPGAEPAAQVRVIRTDGGATGLACATQELDSAIERVLARPEFAWRMPRSPGERPQVEVSPFWREFIRNLAQRVSDGMNWLFDGIRKIRNWLRGFLPHPGVSADAPTRNDWMEPVQALLFALLALVASILGVLAWRWWRGRGRQVSVAAVPVQATPDLLTDETVAPDSVPVDEWLALASDLLAKGEHRLALRAMFLACLAHLGRCGRLAPARAKSNREYLGELDRKAHDLPDVLAAFRGHVAVVERAWYGYHAVTRADLDLFLANQRVILQAKAAHDAPQQQAAPAVRPAGAVL